MSAVKEHGKNRPGPCVCGEGGEEEFQMDLRLISAPEGSLLSFRTAFFVFLFFFFLVSSSAA
jgi:hypothetical protein